MCCRDILGYDMANKMAVNLIVLHSFMQHKIGGNLNGASVVNIKSGGTRLKNYKFYKL